MRLVSVKVEGFKTFGPSTTIGPLNSSYNVVLGDNGCGKSGFFDAISFVLGRRNMKNLRVNNFSELIHSGLGFTTYGAAKVALEFELDLLGKVIVTRTVTMNRDNSTWRSSYTKIINNVSSNSTHSDIMKLLGPLIMDRDSELFIIRQGQVNKVVKQNSKQLGQWVTDIWFGKNFIPNAEQDGFTVTEKILAEAIRKQELELDSLKEEQAKLKECEAHSKSTEKTREEKVRNLQRRKYLIFLHFKARHDEATRKLKESSKETSDDVSKIISYEQEIRRLEAMLDSVNDIEKTTVLRSKYQQSNINLTTATASVETAELRKKEASERVRKTADYYVQEEKCIKKFKDLNKALIDELESTKQEIKVAEEKATKSKDTEEKIRWGYLVLDTGNIVNVRERLNQVITTLAEVRGRFELIKKEFTILNKAIQEMESQLLSCPMDDTAELAYQQAQENVNRLQALLRRNQIDPEEMPNLENLVHEGRQARTRIENKQAGYHQRYPHLHFIYTDPKPDFDRTSVIGFVYEHFSVKNLDTYVGALDVAVGESLFKMVVDTPETAKLLINNGNLSRRTTFLPLSATKGFVTPRNVQKTLDKIFGAGRATLAINLVEYDPKMSAIITSVFRSTVICVDMAMAKAVAYESGLNLKAVTLEGDVVDPGGLMQGGNRENIGKLLRACQDLRQLSLELKQQDESLAKLDSQLEISRRNQNLVIEHSDAVRSLQQCADLLALTTRASLTKELTALRAQLVEKQQALKTIEAELSILNTEEKSLQSLSKDEDCLREKSLEKNIADTIKFEQDLKSAKTRYQANEIVFHDIELELQAQQDSLNRLQKDIEEATNEYHQWECTLQAEQKVLDENRTAYEAFLADLQKLKTEDQQREDIGTRIEEIKNKIHGLELAQITRTALSTSCRDDIELLEVQLRDFKDDHCDLDYERSVHPIPDAALEDLQSEYHQLNGDLNNSSQETFDGAEMQAINELVVTRYNLIEESVEVWTNLQAVGQKLQEFRIELYSKMYNEINRKFSVLLEKLATDITAIRLVQINKEIPMDGCDIEVVFKNRRPTSLSELSGGQKSLVGVMLLLFLSSSNLSPVYLMDEVCATMDGENITRFRYILSQLPETQFICITHNNRMVDCGDTVFTLRLEDGITTVERTVASMTERSDTSANGTTSGEKQQLFVVSPISV